MVETIFPQSPNWFLSKIISTREDGSVAYGSQNNIFILKHNDNQIYPIIIKDAHSEKVTSVAFPPVSCSEKFQNSILSSSEDGYVKLWNIETLMPLIGHKSHWEQGKDSAASSRVVCSGWSYHNPQYIVSAAENDSVVLWDVIGNITNRFYFRKLKPTVLECSHHVEKLVALGSKNGMVYIVKLVKSGEIIHKLRGHDKEVQALSWCPVSVGDDIFRQYLLASSCQEKEIYIWRTLDGACETKIPLPKHTLSKTSDGSHHSKWDNPVNFTPLFWTGPYTLYSGTQYGELISCDLKDFLHVKSQNGDISGKQLTKKNSSCWRLIHALHSKMVMAIAAIFSTTENMTNLKVDASHVGSNNLVGNKLSEEDSNKVGPEETCPINQGNFVWTIGKDQNVIAVPGNSQTNQPVFNFHTLNGHAAEAAVSPHDPNKVAVAGGDGKIRLWSASRPSGYTRVFWQKINDRVHSIAWHPTREGLLAFGTSEGRVGLIEIYTQKQPTVFKVHHHGAIYRLSWGPPFSENGESSLEKKEFCLYFVGNNNLLLHDPAKINSDAFNLSQALDVQFRKFSDLSWKPDYSLLALGCQNGSVYLLRPPKLTVCQVIHGYKKYIRSLEWHPLTTTVDVDCSNVHGYFTFGSIDNDPVIKVFNYSGNDSCDVEQIAALKGHSSNVQSVSWSPHVGGRLISSSGDYTVRIWDVLTNTQLAKFVICQSFLPLFCIWSPIDPDVVIAGIAERVVLSWKISTERGTSPIIKDLKLKKGKNFEMSELLKILETPTEDSNRSAKGDTERSTMDINNLPLAKVSEAQKKMKDGKIFGKVWKSDEDPFQRCYDLLNRNENGPDVNSILGTEAQFLEFLNSEAESCQKSSKWNEYYQISLWRGNLNEVLEEKIKTGHLDDFLVSLAPFVSPRLWREACISYSKSLAEKKMYTKAACYLTAVHEIHDAIELLLKADLYLEAICIARCRLPDSDPVYTDSVRKYADWLTKNGSYLKACECYISLNEYEEAARILGKKNQVDYLSLAAVASKKAGLETLEKEYAFSALLMCLESHNWELASRICRDHQSLKHLSILHAVHREINLIDVGDVILEKDLISHLCELVSIRGDEEVYAALEYIYDRNSLYFDKRKKPLESLENICRSLLGGSCRMGFQFRLHKLLQVAFARELVLACSSVKREILLTHIIRAMNAASRYMNKASDDPSPLYKLCSWLCSSKYLAEGSIFCWEDINIKSKITSLRAFLCQGIVEYVDSVYNSKNEDVFDRLSDLELILVELVSDALDKEAFIYFKNQLEIISSEKEISKAHLKKNRLITAREEDSDLEKNMNLEAPSDASDKKPDRGGEAEKTDVDVDDLIAFEKEKMCRLKVEIKNFENSRLIAPNPAMIYCILRRVSEASRDPQCQLKLTVEEKWKELETS